jgi:single-strand DNA-binding protein
VYFEGRLKTRKWQDKEGKDVYTTEIIADNMQLLGGREGMGGGDSGDDYADRGDRSEARAPAPARSAAPAPRPAPPKPAAKPATGFDDMDDDIPF